MAKKELDHLADISDCQTKENEDMDDKENPFEQKAPNLNWTSEFASHRMLEEKIVGELSDELLPSKEITWEIPNFFELAEEIDYYVYSPAFSLSNSVWCLQMFPNGQKQQNSDCWIDLLLVRLYSHDSKHLVWYKLGIRTCHGKIYESFADFNIFKGRDLEWGVACLLKRSRTVVDEELIAKDGIIRVFCEIQVEERQASVISKQPVSRISPLIKIPDHLKVGKLSEELFSTKDISWKVPDAFTLLEERTCQIVSPSFDFKNSTWFLQMYLTEEKAGKNDTWFGLKLVRLNSSVVRHDIYYTLGIKDRFGKIYDSFSGRYVFGGSAVNWKDIRLLKKLAGENYTDIAPLGCITAFCRFYIKEIVEKSPELPLKSQSDEETTIQLCSGFDNSKEFTWEINNFFQLPTNEGYFTDSKEFSLANARWCLRMYPNGKKEGRSGWICLMLVRLNSCYLEHRIHYRLGIKTFCGKNHETLTHAVTFHANAPEIGVVNLLKRSGVLCSKRKLVNNSILSAFCEIFMIEVTVPSSGDTALFRPSSETRSLGISEYAQQLRLQSSLSDPEIYIWKINNFLDLPVGGGFFIDSAEFSVANATWCMRMYPNGHKGHSKDWIQLFLVRLSSSNPEHRIHYRFGLKKRGGSKEIGTLIHDVSFHLNAVEMGVVDLLKRSELIHRKKRLLPDGALTAFCHIYMIKDFRVIVSNNTASKKLSQSSSKVPLVMKAENCIVGVLEKQSFLDAKEVIWKIPPFSFELMNGDQRRDSPEFLFLNEYWYLQIYVKGKKIGKKNAQIELYLVRINQCPEMYIIAYELGIMCHDGGRIKFRMRNSKRIFQGSVMKLGVSELHFAPNGFVTINFQMLSKERLTETSMLTEQPLLDRDLCKDSAVDMKENKNSTTFFNDNSQVKVSKDEVNILGGGEDIDTNFDALDFTSLKKKKRRLQCNQLNMEHTIKTKNDEACLTRNTDLIVVDIKQDKNCTWPYEESKYNTQDMVSKDEVNILADGKDVDKDFEELDFTLLKKKKEMNFFREVECPIKEKDFDTNLERDTGLVMNATVDLKQDENCMSPYKELKSDTQEMVSKDEVSILADEKDLDKDLEESDFTLLKKKKNKKINFSLEMEHPIKEKDGEANLERDTDHFMGSLIDKKQDESNSSQLEKLKRCDTQKTYPKDDGNVARDGRVIDESNLTLLMEKRSDKSDQCKVEYFIKEKVDEEAFAVREILQDCKKVPFCEKECDVRFFVRGEEFQGHSAILKDHSTFFTSVLQPEAMKSASLVVIDDSDPEIFKIFLQYLHSGRTDFLTTENVFSLYSIANKYSMQKLKTECLQYMKNILSVNTFCDIMAFSLQQKEMEMVLVATDFFTKNVTHIIATSKWQMFLKENFTSANKLIMKGLKK